MLPFIAIMLLVLALGFVACILLDERMSKLIAIAASGITLLLAFAILATSINAGAVSLSETYGYYISSLNIAFGFQLTPISFTLLLMASIVAFVTVLSGNVDKDKPKTANSLILGFEFAAIGLFASANLLLFFIFWDIGVIALFFMLYLLGSANRRRAAVKFIMYELFASLLLFLGIIMIYFYTPVQSFDINYIIANAPMIPAASQFIIFILLLVAFLVNMPVFPFHLWLPEAHTEASTQGSMLLSGILTKFGGYGMILLFLMLPIVSKYSTEIALLAGFSAFYSVFVLMTQFDIKRVIAYTTIVEMSIILVGISTLNSFGLYGATYAMLAHGLTVAMLFLAAGSVGYIFANRDYRTVRGVIKSSVATAYTFLAGIFATTGVPLTAAFIGDLLIFIGAVEAFGIAGAIPLFALVLLGAFLYFVVNKSFISTSEVTNSVEYIDASQKIGYALLLIFIIIFGILPFVILNLFK